MGVLEFGDEEVISAVRYKDSISFKSRSSHQSQKEPGEFDTISIAAFPDVLHRGCNLFFVAFFLLQSLAGFVGSVADLLDAIVDLPQLHFGWVGRQIDFSNFRSHAVFAQEAFQLVIEKLPPQGPKLLGIWLRNLAAVDEIHARLELIGR